MASQCMLILLAFGAVGGVVFGSADGDDLSVNDVFFGLLILLAVSAAVLWLRSDRGERAELKLESLGWADRVHLPATQAQPAQISAGSALAKATHALAAF